jgi:hypothetical protein
LNKVEAEIEKIRNENYVLLDKNMKAASQLNEKTFRLIKLEEELAQIT